MRSVVGFLLVASLMACSSPPRPPCAPGTPLGSVCGFENPEDVEWVPAAGIVLVTNLRLPGRTTGGFLASLVPGATTPRHVWPTGAVTDFAPDPSAGDPTCSEPLQAETFAPHGLTSVTRDGATRVYVVAHSIAGSREAIEIFALRGTGTDVVAAWIGCVPTPENVMANDVVVAPDGEIVASNYQPSESLWYMVKGAGFHQPTGDVIAWRHPQGWRHLANTSAAMANGVAVSSDGASVFYAETATGDVHRVARSSDGPKATVNVGGNPDNLSWTARGTLLVAVHIGGSGFLGCGMGWSLPCRTPWEIHEIDPQTMTSKRILAHDGSVVGAVASVIEVGNLRYFGGVFDDRIGVGGF